MVADGVADIKGAHCMKVLDDLAAAGVPDSRTIEVQYDTPEFKRGVHPLAEIRKSCELVERLGKIKAFEFWALLAKQDADRKRLDMGVIKNCVSTYEQIIKAGIAPTDRVNKTKIQFRPMVRHGAGN